MPAPLGFLRPRVQREGSIAVRQAVEHDSLAIERLASTSPYCYSGLGGAMREAIRDDLVVTAWQTHPERGTALGSARGGGEDTLAGFVTAHRQGPVVAWIHALVLAAETPMSGVGQALLQELEEQLAPAGVSLVAYMDEFRLSWMRRLLERAGFHCQTHVVSYEGPLRTPPAWGNQEVAVRPAGLPDIATIARLDQAAFGPLWAYSGRVLQTVLGQVGCFLVAERGGEACGYVLCTFHQDDRAHVVRLAVDPALQGQQIGVRLLAEAFAYCQAQGVRWISLNTQEENRRSQRLYRWFGFRPTGEEVGVWVKEVAGESGHAP